MREIILTDAPDQELTTILNGQRCALRFRYNVSIGRWSFDLKIRDAMVLHGQRIVLDTDLLAKYEFGVGKLAAFDWEDAGNLPDRQALPQRRVRLFHMTEDEIAQAWAVRDLA